MVDLEEPTLTLKDASGLGDAPTKSQAGDSATGKVGSTTFAFSDASGNVALAPLSANGVKTDGSAVTQPVSAASLPLPTGASTAANQATANASLASIDAGIPAALGQTTQVNSMPVTIASDQDYPFSGANNAANPSQAISIGADDAANIRRLQGRISNPLVSDFGLVIRQIPHLPDTFVIQANGIAPGNGKSMLSVFNAGGSTVMMRLVGLWIYSVQTASVAGVMNDFGLRKISAMSAGTAINTTGAATGLIMPMDSTMALNASITAATGATVTESPAFDVMRWLWSSDEFGAGAADSETTEHTNAQLVAAYRSQENETPFTFRAGQGFSVRQSINTTLGSFNIRAIVTQETP